MRILIAGEGYWPWYQGACADALRSLGHCVKDFSWYDFFVTKRKDGEDPIPKSVSARIENRLKVGPRMVLLNRALLRAAEGFMPDVVFVYNGTNVFASTLTKLKSRCPKTFLVQYSNDNPFGRGASRLLWRHVIRAIPHYDLHFVYRHLNIEEFKRSGAKAVELLRSYYIPERDYRVELQSEHEHFRCDVVFAGHYENDLRVGCLEEVCRTGYRLNLFGGGWGAALTSLSPDSPLRGLFPVRPVVGEDYLRALSGSKIALCFLSKLNRDTYTRRNFEIPATKTFMLTEYSEDISSLFREGYEAEFFRCKSELGEKIAFYLSHEGEREAIAQRGYERLVRDGHDVVSRMKQAMDHICGRKGGN